MTVDSTMLAALARRWIDVLHEAVVVTPVETLTFAGRTFRVKREDLQVTGSFKVRGALLRLSQLDASRARFGVVTASHGNHGRGLAWAAARLGINATVVVPNDTPAAKCAAIRELGAELVIHDAPGYDEAEVFARQLAATRHATFVSPFDDPWVQAGNGGTVGIEILEQVPAVEQIVVPVGGGGLIGGLAAAVHAWAPLVDIVGVQSVASAAMTESLKDGHAHVTWPAAPTLAEGLEGGIAESTFALCRQHLVRMHTVTEAAIASAMACARREHGIVLEGSSAVVLAAIAAGAVSADERTVVVLTGANVDAAVLDTMDAAAGTARSAVDV